MTEIPRGNEVSFCAPLSRSLEQVEPNWKPPSPEEAATRINQQGLAAQQTAHEDGLRPK